MFLVKPQAFVASIAASSSSSSSPPRLRAAEWKYVAEGGANVLFRHHPELHPSSTAAAAATREFYGKLLRVKKCDVAPSPSPPSASRKNSASNSTTSTSKSKSKSKSGQPTAKTKTTAAPYPAYYPHPRHVLAYATEDILPYLAEHAHGASHGDHGHEGYEQVAQLLEVEHCFLVELNAALLALESRPAHRRQSQIDVGLQCVMVLPDVTLPPPDEDPLLFFEDADDGDEAHVHARAQAHAHAPAPAPARAPSTAAKTQVPGQDAQTAGALLDAMAAEPDAPTCESTTSSCTDGESSDLDAEMAAAVAATLTLARTHGIESAGEEEEEEDGDGGDTIARPPSPPPPSPPQCQRQRQRMLSTSCNVFDCCFRNICVEIKPKIGFKPSGALVSAVKTRVCRFCMHQHYKKATGKVEEISEYCPLDLFSMNADRIRHALRALQRTPQNNFKVFVRSNQDEVVNVITGMNADALPKGAARAKYSCRRKRMGLRHSCQSVGTESEMSMQLQPPSPSLHASEKEGAVVGHHASDSERLLPDVVELLTEVLLKLEILQDLKKMQQLDHISADGMWHLQRLVQRVSEWTLSEAAGVMATHDEDTPPEVTVGEIVEALQQEDEQAAASETDVAQAGSLARSVAFLEESMPYASTNDWRTLDVAALKAHYDQLEQRFHVATTLKDCSLLLCLRRATDEDEHGSSDPDGTGLAAKHAQGQEQHAPRRPRFEHLHEYEHRIVFRDMVFNCVVAVVDLDVKSHKSVADYYRLDEKIVQHFVARQHERGFAGMRCDES